MKQHYHSYQIHFTLGSCLMESSLLPVCFDTVYYRNACLLCLFHSNLSRSARSAHLLLLALGGGGFCPDHRRFLHYTSPHRDVIYHTIPVPSFLTY